jgi:glycosyltransferase involved in cell wall biosynthesis
MSNPRFTIIIPHKNSQKDLERCLISIPDIEDIQVIVVDDNSDNLDEANFPGTKRQYTQVIFNHDGLGAGHARNVALKEAKGEWLLFSDADDYFVDNMYEMICKSIDKAQEDIIFFTLKIDRDGEQGGYIPVQNYCAEHIDDKNVDYNLRYKCTQPWDKLIRHSLVKEHNISFQETTVSNDYLFSVQTGYYAKHIKLVPQPLYVYVIRNNNSLWHISNYQSLETRIRVYCDVLNFQKTHGVKTEDNIVDGILADILYNYPSMFRSQVEYVSKKLGTSKFKLMVSSAGTLFVSLLNRIPRKIKSMLK